MPSRTIWRSRVYGVEKAERDMTRKQYKIYLREFCQEFNYTCQACRRRYSAKSGLLGLHHIIACNEGGQSIPENLILLCHQCHDAIESDRQKYRCYTDIAFCFARRIERVSEQKRVEIGERWQSWVYGGKCNPLKSKTI